MPNALDVLVERLLAWDVDTIFGLSGDGINGVFEALRKQQDKIRGYFTFGTKRGRHSWLAPMRNSRVV